MAAASSTAQELVIAGFGGLSVYSDPELRTKDTWQVLDNFDLVIDGSIRKILPATLVAGPFPNPLYQLLEYRKAINYQGGGLRLVAVDVLGNLWDVNGSTVTPYSTSLTSQLAGIIDIPFMGQMQGYYVPFVVKTWIKSTAYSLNDAVYRYSATDGNLYVYFVSTAGTSDTTEPKWPATQGSTVVDSGVTWTNAGILSSQRFKLNYGIVVTKGFPAMKFVEWKYDPTNDAETPKITGARIGVSMPLDPINATADIITPNLNGYDPQTGRAYVWTYYNPNTLHDSSPAPFVGPTKITDLDASASPVELPGSILAPLALPTKGNKFSSYQSIQLEIALSYLTAPYGDGYTCIRCWATKDGGASFFLLTSLYDADGNVLTNGDGSIPIATLTAQSVAGSYTGFVPLPTPQNAQATVRIYDGGAGTPVNLVPDPQNFGPESWVERVGNQLAVIPNDSPLGQASFEYVGTGNPAPTQRYRSINMHLQAGVQYAFSGYIDNTNGAGGTVSWDIVSHGVIVHSFQQADNTEGTLTGTFTATHANTHLRATVDGVTVTLNKTVLLSDPVIEQGSSISAIATIYPTPDTSLVYPAPAPLSQNPPPATCLMGVIFANTLFLVDFSDPTRLVYCNPGDLNSYGVNSFIQFPSDRSFSIVELIPAADRLLVSSGRSIEQVLSNSPNVGFANFPFDPQHGSLSYRGSIPYGSGVFALMDPGIAMLNLSAKLNGAAVSVGFTPEAVISRPIKPLLDAIDPATIHVDSDIPGEPIPVIDNKQDLYILGFRSL